MKRRGRMRGVERPEKAFLITPIKCDKTARKILQLSLRGSRPRTTCHDIVVECTGHEAERGNFLLVRADCTSEKTARAFEEMASGYAQSVQAMLE